MLLAFTGLILGIALLVYCADRLIQAATQLATIWRIPAWIVGVTIVAFGTSLPEFVVNLSSAVAGHPDIAIGTVVGSDVINVLFIIGVLVLINPAVLRSGQNYPELLFMIVVAVVAALLFWQGDGLSRADGGGLIILFLGYITYLFRFRPSETTVPVAAAVRFWRAVTWFIVALIGLAVAGSITTQSAVQLAEIVGLSQAFISLTIIGLGTSLPELATSAMAAWRKQTALSLGNIVGSFVLNIIVILGVTSLIQPLEYNHSFDGDVYFMIGGSVVLLLAVWLQHRTPLRRSLAILFLGSFVYYLINLLQRHGF
ncbi:MAG: calcium/sodium antiporter [Candidatus Kerfeldbacteria bacterium]|nr:calcium/sodium antiporter [Candidatus Kerfeldbacteria bacterium]